MSRETKQERIIKAINDQVLEHLHHFKQIVGNQASKELDVERWAESVLRMCLGYTATNGYTIQAQESKGRMRPDLVVSKDSKPILVVEVKKLSFDLNKSDFRSGKLQLNEYLKTIGGVQWGILTNGYEWRLFDFSNPAFGGIVIASFTLGREKEEIDVSRKALEEICWNFVDFHESAYCDEKWIEFSKEATAFSPESLARAILSADLIKQISKVIRGEHDYKANVEVLFDKVQELIVSGLDDAVTDWNETKEAELNKFISSQKRLSRRKRSSQKIESAAQSQPAIVSTSEMIAVAASQPQAPVEAASVTQESEKKAS